MGLMPGPAQVDQLGSSATPPITWARSTHHSDRKGTAVRWIVLHADVSPRESSTVSWLLSPASKVSYHALVHRDGKVTRFVVDSRAAWACGSSEYGGVVGLNRHTLSLAFSNRHDGVERLTDAQVDAARWLIEDWRARYPSIEGVLTHAMISPGRKKDPNVIPNFYRHDYT